MNYYKILNENECHNKFQFQDGLNIDSIPFNPKGTCEPGGIYFAREDIFAFLGYGPWIRTVTLPEDAQIYKDPEENPSKWKADKIILGQKRRIDSNIIKELIEQGADIHVDNDFAFRFASEFGHLETVKFLVEQGANIHANNDSALRTASLNGHLEIVKYLVEQGADIHVDNDEAIIWASKYGYIDIVEFLKNQK